MTTKIKERGILMHARSVNNILAGRKTQTRRIIKPQPTESWDARDQGMYAPMKVEKRTGFEYPGDERFGIWGDDWDTRCPYGQPGDRLWVREAWRYYASALSPEANFGIQFRADGAINYWPDWDKAMQAQCSPSAAWRPSLFMPRWASRITLEIVNVRVERVQDISLDDIRAEGVRCRGLPPEDEISYLMPIAFQSLWDDTNGKGAWDRNDWVWVVEFKRILETA